MCDVGESELKEWERERSRQRQERKEGVGKRKRVRNVRGKREDAHKTPGHVSKDRELCDLPHPPLRVQ